MTTPNNALLAKLAGAEMPEPAYYWEPDGTIKWKITHYYTHDQLKAYGAACAAAQLSAEPVADVDFQVEEDGPSLTFSPRWYGQLSKGTHKLYTLKDRP